MEILTPFQKTLLKHIGQSPLAENFYLTGGTALAAFYLKHRLSEDLDFFTPDPNALTMVPAAMSQIAANVGGAVDFTRRFNTFLECFIHSHTGDAVKFDFAYDSPFRLRPVVQEPMFGIQLDNWLDIGCNKLSALFDRAAGKDFIDVYFLCQELLPFEQLLAFARQKHVGIDDYWLAVALRRVQTIQLLPRMVQAVDLVSMQAYFLQIASQLMKTLE